MPEVGQALRKVRQERKLTLRQAAELIGCSYQTLANWELGASVPHPLFKPGIERFLRSIAKADA